MMHILVIQYFYFKKSLLEKICAPKENDSKSIFHFIVKIVQFEYKYLLL